MSQTYINLTRSAATKELLKKHHKEYILLSTIAIRARRTPGFGLEAGEALVGDFKEMGLTRQSYRSALLNLEKWGFLTVKATNRGTIVKLIDSTVFNINAKIPNQQPNQQPTIKQPTANQQPTTNKNVKNVTRKKRRSLSDRIDSICFPPNLESSEVKHHLERWCKRMGYNWYSDPESLQGFVEQFRADTAKGFAEKLRYALDNTTWKSLCPSYFDKTKKPNGRQSYVSKADSTTLLMAEAANNIKEKSYE